MTNSNETKTVVKSEALFLTVGKYIIFFQWIEGVVDQCLLLLWGHENWAETQKRLAGSHVKSRSSSCDGYELSSRTASS